MAASSPQGRYCGTRRGHNAAVHAERKSVERYALSSSDWQLDRGGCSSATDVVVAADPRVCAKGDQVARICPNHAFCSRGISAVASTAAVDTQTGLETVANWNMCSEVDPWMRCGHEDIVLTSIETKWSAIQHPWVPSRSSQDICTTTSENIQTWNPLFTVYE